MSHPVRIGIIGLGRVFERYAIVIEPMVRAGRAVVVSGYDPSPERCAVAQALFPGMRVARDAQDVIASDDVDAVLVLTSMQEHGELAAAASRGGTHVRVETPMEPSSATPMYRTVWRNSVPSG